MSNIFIHLAPFKLDTQILQKCLEKDRQCVAILEEFDQQAQLTLKQYADLLVSLITKSKSSQSRQKLIIVLIYFVVNIGDKDCLQIVDKIKNLEESIYLRIKFFSLLFKSTKNQALKKTLLFYSVQLMQNEPKISYFSSFVENFQQFTSKISLTDEEVIQLSGRLIRYLEKHLIYKQLCPTYLAQALLRIKDDAKSKKVSDMIVKIIKLNTINSEVIKLLNHQKLKENQMYAALKIFLTADFNRVVQVEKQLEKQGVNINSMMKKMKIQSIPRLFSDINSASYQQMADLLKIRKFQVQTYVIEAIRQGIIKAKIDEFEQSILINHVNFKFLREQERLTLQKDITNTINRLGQI